ncbi:MAG: quinolinate synthase [Candidatus Cloacimonadota bacterium]|nr:MAG: quinolinate synthase [Candidatus Cloacimonadota bacterium]
MLIDRINRLKKEKNAIILAHNYQISEVQETADFVGDSLQLAQEAEKVEADIIVFAGVKFMAETAKLLNPEVKVLLSHGQAGCPMADMITGEQLKKFKEENHGSVVVCYVNSSIDVKAESDLCCTSSNAVKLINALPEDKKILFVPDKNLGTWSAKQTGRNIKVWEGCCNVHNHLVTLSDVKKVRSKYPGYKLLVHPECRIEVCEAADFVASTKGMADFVAKNDNVIIGTEVGLVDALKIKYPGKNIVPLSERTVCVNMKKTALEDILLTLEEEKNEIILDKDIAEKALSAVERMLQMSR